MPRTLVLSFSDLRTDPRVARQIDWLADGGHEVTAAGLAAPSRPDVRYLAISPNEHRSVLLRVKRGLKLLARQHDRVYWSLHRAAWNTLQSETPDLIVANDLETLPLAVRLGEETSAPVVYDAHEYSPGEFDQSFKWRLLRRPYAKSLCRRYLTRVSAITTVGPGIADAYEELLGMRPEVIVNAPPYNPGLTPTPVLRDRIRVVHHGLAEPSRKIENMLRVAELLDSRFEVHFILIAGNPRYRDHLCQMAAGRPSIHFDPPVAMTAIPGHLNQFDLGLFLLEPTNFNYRHALPNKFFEFIQARLGIAIGPSPDMAALVRSAGNGIVSEDFRPESLARDMNRLTTEEVTRVKQASHAAAREFSAEGNRGKWLEVCERAMRISVAV